MREVGAVIGGEGNGGVIDPRVGWVRDPFIGMGLILQLMAETGKTAERTGRRAAELHDRQGQVHGAARTAAEAERGLDARWPEAKVEPRRRPAARLARPLGARAAQQHRADRPRHRRGAASKQCAGRCVSRWGRCCARYVSWTRQRRRYTSRCRWRVRLTVYCIASCRWVAGGRGSCRASSNTGSAGASPSHFDSSAGDTEYYPSSRSYSSFTAR